MTSPGPLPTLRFYERAGCELCDEARQALQAVLEERVIAGAVVPKVHPIDVTRDDATERDYGYRIRAGARRAGAVARDGPAGHPAVPRRGARRAARLTGSTNA